MEERLDRREALISCRHAVQTRFFEIIEELDDQFAIEPVDVDLFGLYCETRADKADQQSDAIAVAGDGVGGQAAFGGQMLLKK